MEAGLRSLLRKGIKISLFISIAVTLVIFAFTVEKKTLHALRSVRVQVLLFIVLLWLLFVFFDGLRLSILSRANKRTLGLRKSIEIILVGNYLAAITPFQTGGFPVQLILLNKQGINPGRGMVYLAIRGLLIYLPIYLSAPFFAIGYVGSNHSVVVELLIKYMFAILSVFLVLFFYSLLKPDAAENLLIRLKKRFKGKAGELLGFLIEEIEEFRIGLRIYLQGKNWKYLFGAFVVSIFSLLFYLSLIPMILYGLGLDPKLPLSVMVQILLMAFLLYIPTPGAGGVAEAGGAALFALVCPKHLLGIFIVLWRFFTFYLGALIGGLIAIKEV